MYVYMYVNIHIYVYMYACISVCMHLSVLIYIHTCNHTYQNLILDCFKLRLRLAQFLN